jgi:hypothetical protein
MTWDNNLEANLENGAITLEHLEAEILGSHDGDHAAEMPLPSTSRFLDAMALPLASQPRTLHGAHVAPNRVPRPLPHTLTPLVHRS